MIEKLIMDSNYKRDHRGENNPNVKLTKAQVNNIRYFLRNGYSGRQLASIYNIAPCTVSEIKNRRIWNDTN